MGDRCFNVPANPFLEMMGLELLRWEMGAAEFRLLPRPEHLNRTGLVQGGVIATMLDVACGYAGLYAAPDQPEIHGATVSLSINYVAAARAVELRATGNRVGGGRQIFFSYAELRDESDKLIATAQGTFRLASN